MLVVMQVQQALKDRGFLVATDGKAGDETWTAIREALAVAPKPGVSGVSLAWGKKVSPQFRDGVWWICDKLGWSRQQGGDGIMSCMAWESDESFSPSKRNYAGSGAVGLIQFMPETAAHLGTTVDALAAMTPERQLGFVYKYFAQFAAMRGPAITLADMYMAILLPRYIGAAEDAVLFSGGTAYRQNSGLDANRDGKVTKLEAAAKVYAKLERGRSPACNWTQ